MDAEGGHLLGMEGIFTENGYYHPKIKHELANKNIAPFFRSVGSFNLRLAI